MNELKKLFKQQNKIQKTKIKSWTRKTTMRQGLTI